MSIDWRALLTFEARYQLVRWRFVVMTVALSAFAVTMVATGYAADGIAVNAPAAVMQSLGLLSLWALFTQTIFTVHGALRDREHGMSALVEAQPIGRGTLTMVRAIGVVAAGVLAFGIATLVLLMTPQLPLVEAARVMPLRVDAYLIPLLTLVVPNVLLVSALLLLVAAIGRSTMATYVGAVALFAGYMLTALAVSSPLFAGGAPPTPDALARAAVLDPFGLSAFFEQSRYWTAAQREQSLVTLGGRYLLNRALWAAVAAGALAVAARLMHRVAPARRTPRTATEAAAAPASDVASRHPYRASRPSPGGAWAAWASAVRMELRLLVGSWAIRALLLVLVVVVSIEVLQNLGAGEYGTRLLPTSSEVARRALDPLSALGVIVLLYLAIDIAWRERAVRFDGIVDATPHGGGLRVLAKLAALVVLCAVFAALAATVGMALQIGIGGVAVEPLVYTAHAAAAVWPLALWAVAVGAAHAITGNRWAGLLAGLVLVITRIMGDSIGLEHPMTRFASAPMLRWSDFDGFGPSWPSFVALLAFWSAVALWLAVVAWGAWPRGQIASLRVRVGRAWRGDVPRWRTAIIVSTMLVTVGAVSLVRATWSGNAWRGQEATRQWRAAYEQRFRALHDRAQPRMQHVEVVVQLHPAERRAAVSGTVHLRNLDAQSIDTVWMWLDPAMQNATVRIGRAVGVQPDARFSMWAVPLATPLASGDSATLTYAFSIDRTRVTADGYDRALTTNGSYLTTDELLPLLGYNGRMELGDSATRARLGLGAATPQLQARAAAAEHLREIRRIGPTRAWMTARIVVSTDSTQHPLATGELRRTWSEGDRRFAEYMVDSLTPPRLGVLSGRYAVRRRAAGATTVEVWYHPTHTENVDRVLHAAVVALGELERRFGPYTLPTLRIVEVPAGWGFGAFALPGTILLTETRGMRLDPRREQVDLLLRRIGHEVAHQWWGGVVSPADVDGAGTIVEALAKYAEQRVVASVHGDSALAPMLAFDHDRYLVGRAQESAAERTLADAGFVDDYLFYGKAAIGFRALHDALGDSAMTAALRAFIAAERGPRGAATTDALRAAIDAHAATPATRALIAEWFDARVIHELVVDTATVQPRGARFHVVVRGHVDRVTRVGRGEEAHPASGAEVEVWLGSEYATAQGSWSGRVACDSAGRFTVAVTLDAPPTIVELDPRYLRVDPNRSNNRRAVVPLASGSDARAAVAARVQRW